MRMKMKFLIYLSNFLHHGKSGLKNGPSPSLGTNVMESEESLLAAAGSLTQEIHGIMIKGIEYYFSGFQVVLLNILHILKYSIVQKCADSFLHYKCILL